MKFVLHSIDVPIEKQFERPTEDLSKLVENILKKNNVTPDCESIIDVLATLYAFVNEIDIKPSKINVAPIDFAAMHTLVNSTGVNDHTISFILVKIRAFITILMSGVIVGESVAEDSFMFPGMPEFNDGIVIGRAIHKVYPKNKLHAILPKVLKWLVGGKEPVAPFENDPTFIRVQKLLDRALINENRESLADVVCYSIDDEIDRYSEMTPNLEEKDKKEEKPCEKKTGCQGKCKCHKEETEEKKDLTEWEEGVKLGKKHASNDIADVNLFYGTPNEDGTDKNSGYRFGWLTEFSNRGKDAVEFFSASDEDDEEDDDDSEGNEEEVKKLFEDLDNLMKERNNDDGIRKLFRLFTEGL